MPSMSKIINTESKLKIKIIEGPVSDYFVISWLIGRFGTTEEQRGSPPLHVLLTLSLSVASQPG